MQQRIREKPKRIFQNKDDGPTHLKCHLFISQGPVGGSTFLLRTPLALHHPEAFESFFLHVAPMWMTFPMRWSFGRKIMERDGASYSKLEVIKHGFCRVYFPWVLLYGTFLTLQPWLPVVKDYETLFDLFLLGL